eukprot:m.147241 g.147241  ORF g.147241 m.147241 type:complete len:78 (-) comp9703_c0_seq3:2207-2440(-)
MVAKERSHPSKCIPAAFKTINAFTAAVAEALLNFRTHDNRDACTISHSASVAATASEPGGPLTRDLPLQCRAQSAVQ